MLDKSCPKVAVVLDEARSDVLVFVGFPAPSSTGDSPGLPIRLNR